MSTYMMYTDEKNTTNNNTENKRCRLQGIRYDLLSVQYFTILLLAYAKLRQVSDIR